MEFLEIYTEFVNWAFIIYLIAAAIGTECFDKLQWTLTFIILGFSYFMRFVSQIEDKT